MKSLIAALIKFQKEVPVIPKNKLNPHYKSYYAELSTVIDTCLPVLNKNGLLVSQTFNVDAGQNTLVTRLLHESSETLESFIYLPDLQDAQKLTGAITYLRRTSYLSILGLCADEDDDGNAVSRPPQRFEQKQESKPQIDGPATDGQLKAIYAISKKKGIEMPKISTFNSASAWIKQNGG
jgi:hypothetical protein